MAFADRHAFIHFDREFEHASPFKALIVCNAAERPFEIRQAWAAAFVPEADAMSVVTVDIWESVVAAF